ncbi:MFS transporter [Rhodovibrionaceae bacterium A322]
MSLSKVLSHLPVTILFAASMVVLTLVAWGDSARVYLGLRLERAETLVQVVTDQLVIFSETGLPLSQFSGFENQARTILATEPAVLRLNLYNEAGQVILSYGVQDRTDAEGSSEDISSGDIRAEDFQPVSLDYGPKADVASSGDLYRLSSFLTSRYGSDLLVEVLLERRLLDQPVRQAYWPLVIAIPFVTLALLLLAMFLGKGGGSSESRRDTWLFGLSFCGYALALIVITLKLFTSGIESRIDGLSHSLAERLSAATEMGLDPRDMRGVTALFDSYRVANGDINWVALVSDQQMVLHSDPIKVGRAYEAEAGNFISLVPLRTREASNLPDMEVALAVPYWALASAALNSTKNFAVLFIACGVAAFIMISLGQSFSVPPSVSDLSSRLKMKVASSPSRDSHGQLARIRAAYFLGVFIDSLAISFLPRYSTSLALESGYGAAAGSWPFTVFFILLSLALVPAGSLARKGRMKELFVIGLGLATVGLLLLAVTRDFHLLLFARALSGAGQAFLLVAAQAYALRLTHAGRRTEAVALQIYGYNAGLLAGAAIGGLLATFTTLEVVFASAAVIGLATLLLALLVLHALPPERKGADISTSQAFALTFKDRGLLVTLFSVGLLSKFILTGVVFFALPLLLSGAGFSSNDIGQLLMVFAISTLLLTPFAARWSDRSRNPRSMLIFGGCLSALGVFLFAVALGGDPFQLMESELLVSAYLVPLVLLSVLLLGAGQGLVAAPLVSQVTHSRTAQLHGGQTALSAYRILERGGHVAGPIGVSRLLQLGSSSFAGLLTICGLTLAGLLVFSLFGERPDKAMDGQKKSE